MASVNKVILIGRLGMAPELSYTPSNIAKARLRMATDRVWTGQDGQRQEKTDWHTVIVWRKDAENCERYLQKGSQVYVEGRIETREWQDKDGQKRYTTEIIGDRVMFLGGRGEGGPERPAGESHGGGGGQRHASGPAPGMDGPPDDFNPGDDDIPF